MPGCSTSAARARRRSPASARRSSASTSASCPACCWSRSASLGAALFGAAWAFIPGWLQAKARQPHRHHDDHVQLARQRADGLPARERAAPAGLDDPGDAALSGARRASRSCTRCWARFGIAVPPSQLNLSLVLALAAAFGVWLLIYRTRLGYAIRAVGQNPSAARLCRHLAGADHRSSPWSSPARSPAASRSTSSWATSTGSARVHRRLRLRRHRRGADGPRPSGRHRAGLAPVRHALPGRRRARLRAAGASPATWWSSSAAS